MEEQNNEQLTAKDRLAKLDKILDEYEEKIGLSEYNFEYKNAKVAQGFMEVSREEMEAYDAEDCAQAAIILNGFAFHIQRSKNRETARKKWAEAVLRKVVTPRLAQYARSSGSFNHQFDAATLGDDYSNKVLSIRDYAEQREHRLDFLANSVNATAESFKNLERAKRSKNYGQN